MDTKRCISSLTLEELAAELKALGQPGFRAKQIFHWVHQKLVTEFSAMTDQPKTQLAKQRAVLYRGPADRASAGGQRWHREISAADGGRQLH